MVSSAFATVLAIVDLLAMGPELDPDLSDPGIYAFESGLMGSISSSSLSRYADG